LTESLNSAVLAILRAAGDGVFVVDEEGDIIFANGAGCRIFGYGESDLLGRPIETLIFPDLRGRHIRERSGFATDPRARRMGERKDLVARHRDGTAIPVEVSLTPFAEAGRRLVCATVSDISERKRMEERLALAEIVYRAIGDAVMVVDAGNRILAVNDEFTRLTAYAAPEVVGLTPAVLRSGLQDEGFYQRMRESLEVVGRWQGEVQNRRKDGGIIRCWLVINTVYDDAGRVSRRIGMFSPVSKRKQLEQIIWEQANFDPLTGLLNRRMFGNRLEQEIAKAKRDSLSFAVMFIDLDEFKDINDTLGHIAGDSLLGETTRRIRECCRASDTVARMGGDEFAIIVGDLGRPEDAIRLADSIVKRMKEPVSFAGETTHVTASIGIAVYPADGRDAATLLKCADQAMYEVKRSGRNGISYFKPEMQKTAERRLMLQEQLRQALSKGQFHILYQPIVRLSDGAVAKAEALLRWEHPLHGTVSPAEFIPLAEKTGVILEIGEWVFRMAVEQAERWQARHDPGFQITVNKSPLQFKTESPRSPDWIEMMKRRGMRPDSIGIEITESGILESTDRVIDKMSFFHDCGVPISLDDFGTGYSSLPYLQNFEIDYVKIDRSFIRSIAMKPKDHKLCNAIIAMAHELGMTVVAEGIETRQQRDMLVEAGCDYGQGYLFSKPITEQEMDALLAGGPESRFMGNS